MNYRTLWKSLQLRLPAEVLLLIIQAFKIPVQGYHTRLNYKPLRSCCLVCKAWRPICQRQLFENVILRRADHFDKLCSLKWGTASDDLLTYVHRIHFSYGPSYHRLGEVIPQLVELCLPNLKCLEISSSNGAYGPTLPAFPIRYSFMEYTSQLSTIRSLKISRFKFTCLAEFRSFIGTFGGLRRLEVESIRLGPDQQEDCRPLYGTQNQSLRVVTGDFLHANFLIPYAIHSTFWINDRRDLAEPADVTPKTISETVRETPCPALKPDAARLLVSIHKPLRDTKAEWTCMDGEKQQWELANYKLNGRRSILYCRSLWAPKSASASNRPVFDLSDLRSIYLNKEYLELKEEPENTLDEYKPLDDLLGRLRNLEELDINTIRSDSDYFDEVCLGHGQLIAETLRKVRQRCSLKISYGVDRQPVCWRHLFEQDVVVEDRNDYRERARNRWNQRKRDQLECEERKVMTGKVKREEERKKEEKERREEERKEKEEELWKEVSKWIKWEEEEEEEEGILPTISQAGSYNSWTYLCMSPHFDERQNPLMGAPPAPFGRGPENPPFVISSPYPVERHNPSTYLLRPPNFVTEEIPLPSASTGSSVFSDWMGSGPTEEFDRWPHLHSGGGVNLQLTNFLAPADFSEGVDPPRGSFSVFLDWPDSGPGEEFDRWLHDLWDARGGDAVQY